MDIVVADLERSNLRIAEVERRNGELRSEIAALQSGKGTGAEERANKLETNFHALELEYDNVAQKLEQLQAEHKSEKDTLEKRLKTLEKDVARRQEEADGLKMKLRSLDDYDEMKRELEILKVPCRNSSLTNSISSSPSSTMTIRTRTILCLLTQMEQPQAAPLKLFSSLEIRSSQMISLSSEYLLSL